MIAPLIASCQIEDVGHLLQKLQRHEPMGSALRECFATLSCPYVYSAAIDG
jgi:hypothetical protein